MYGRRYSLLIGRSYGIQQTFTPDVPGIDSQEFLGFRYTGTLPGSPLLEQGGLAERYLPSSSKEAVYKRRTPEEIAAIQSAILAGFVEFDLDSYINLYYTDPTLFEESAGFLQFENIEITDHHIEFDIEKIGGNSTDGNECKLVVYNLSDTEADFISGLASTQNFAQFSAGYADEGLKMLIRGNIEVVEDKLDGTDRRTELLIKDGSKFV